MQLVYIYLKIFLNIDKNVIEKFLLKKDYYIQLIIFNFI